MTIGVGASETLYATMQSLIDPGDEAILISPAFDIYSAQVQMAGGVCKYVPLRLKADPKGSGKQGEFFVLRARLHRRACVVPPPHHSLTHSIPFLHSPAVWSLDMAELRAAFTERTKILLINSPQNPTGKCFDTDELTAISAILSDFPRVVAISDEVYEHMLYDGRAHTRLATIPGMWDRTITISSSGKTFSVTGWKIGWAVGPPHLISGIILTNQWVQFSVSTPSQQAIAWCLARADEPYEGYPSYYAWLNAQYTRKRDILVNGLRAAGLTPVMPEGGFFIIADTSNINVPEEHMAVTTKAAPIMRRDWAFCRYLTLEHKVAAIPPSAFFEGEEKALAANMARFAFCKEDASLHEACKRLLGLRKVAKDPSLLPPLPEEGAAAGGAGAGAGTA